jgi:hypothetical protein
MEKVSNDNPRLESTPHMLILFLNTNRGNSTLEIKYLLNPVTRKDYSEVCPNADLVNQILINSHATLPQSRNTVELSVCHFIYLVGNPLYLILIV